MHSYKTCEGELLEVSSERYLLPFLNTTSEKTKYWEMVSETNILDRQIGRVLLQVHQIYEAIEASNFNCNGKKMLDIGTGNGFIPRILSKYSGFAACVGTDPFLDGEQLDV